jgi:hypothetical protein
MFWFTLILAGFFAVLFFSPSDMAPWEIDEYNYGDN